MSMHSILSQARQAIPGCVAIGLVELSSGRLLDATPIDDLTDVAGEEGPAGAFFGGGGLEVLALAFGATVAGRPGAPRFSEVLAFGDQLVHVLLRARLQADVAAVFVCVPGPDLDATLARARRQFDLLEPAYTARAA